VDAAAKIAFLTAEAAYWRGLAEQGYKDLLALEEAARDAADRHLHSDAVPPEPPVGTRYVDSMDDTAWTRGDAGWRCAREHCRNCPADWLEVWNGDASGNRLRRVLPGEV
jgi:hypothetical protein